jgi:hypothetical protein
MEDKEGAADQALMSTIHGKKKITLALIAHMPLQKVPCLSCACHVE